MTYPGLRFALFLSLCATAACTAEDGVDSSVVAHYQSPLVTVATCQANEDCSNDLELCADGTARVVFTDIVNLGTWSADGDEILTQWRPGDAPRQLRLEIDGDDLRDDRGQRWLRTERPLVFCR